MEIGNRERAAAPVWSIFYGWVVTACAFLVFFLTYGVQYSFGVFLPPMLDELGWRRASLAGVPCTRWCMLLACPPESIR